MKNISGWLLLGSLSCASFACSSASSDDARGANVDASEPDGQGQSHGGGASSAPFPSAGASSSFGGTTSFPPVPPVVGAAGDGAVAPDPANPPVTNPFVVTAHDPLSTFAADVDTASYDIFRRDVNLGSLPAPSTVRLEEYVNAFTYDYPAPEGEHPFAIHLAAAPSVFGDDSLVLRVGIQGKAPPPESKRPANVVFLVDVSGSMQSADKLPLVRQVLGESIELLDPTDTISLVTYAGSVGVRLEPTPASDAGTIRAAIDGLTSGGSTAGAAGIDLAYQQAVAGFIEGGINHVVLCTDGDFNVGPSSTAELLALVRAKRDTGVTLTALGFGAGNQNDAMMEAVSNAGNGIYGVISNSTQASDYVQNRLLSTLVHIAKDVKLQVEFNAEHVLAYRLLGYENRAIADDDFRDDLVDAGEIGAGHRVTALYQVVPAGGAIPTPPEAAPALDGAAYAGPIEVGVDDLVFVKVRYKAPTATDSDPALEVGSSLAVSAVAADLTGLDLDFQWALGIASFAEILKRSPYADATRVTDIGVIVRRPGHQTRPDRAEFVTLFDAAVPRLP